MEHSSLHVYYKKTDKDLPTTVSTRLQKTQLRVKDTEQITNITLLLVQKG